MQLTTLDQPSSRRRGARDKSRPVQAASVHSRTTQTATMATGRHRRFLSHSDHAQDCCSRLSLLPRRRCTGALSDPTTRHGRQTRLPRTGVMILWSLPTHPGRQVRGHHSTTDERLARLPMRLSSDSRASTRAEQCWQRVQSWTVSRQRHGGRRGKVQARGRPWDRAPSWMAGDGKTCRAGFCVRNSPLRAERFDVSARRMANAAAHHRADCLPQAESA